MSVINDIYIGVDGGGTKTKVRVENQAGDLLGQAVGGPANLRLSVHEAWQSIYSTLDEVLKPLAMRLDDKHFRFHAALGLAGLEVTEAVNAFQKHVHPFTTVKLISDAYAACVGAHGDKDGGIIVVGTGVVGLQIQEGKSTQVSGWGFPHDDEGSGAWLGLEATRCTLQWLDHRAEKSPLVEDIFAFFNHDLSHFISWANKANASEFARLAPLVINHAQQEEVAAVRLIKKAAHAIDRIHHGLKKLRQNQEVSFPICLFGGIAPFIEPWLDETLRSCLVPRQADANVGAILILKRS